MPQSSQRRRRRLPNNARWQRTPVFDRRCEGSFHEVMPKVDEIYIQEPLVAGLTKALAPKAEASLKVLFKAVLSLNEIANRCSS